MIPQLFDLACAPTRALLIFLEVGLAAFTGGSISRILHRERRRRERREAARRHYTRSMEDFPELRRPNPPSAYALLSNSQPWTREAP